MSTTLEDLDARIRSRMLDTRLCSIIEILAPSYRVGVIKTPARKARS